VSLADVQDIALEGSDYGKWETATPTEFVKWYIIRTRGRQERQLWRDLRAREIGCFLPLADEVRYYGRRKVRVEAALFPGYVFVFGSRDEAFVADRNERAAQLIEVRDQRQLHEELTAIAGALRAGKHLARCAPLVRGTVVEVTSGPLKGVRGRVDMNLRDNRLVLNVDMIGHAAALEIDRDLLRPV
jgi:transcription antitermination factor NusG